MKLIVGLGNPGDDYARTRHNIGFRVVDAFAEKFRISVTTHEKKAWSGQGRVAGRAVTIAKPETFMNLSGEAVEKLVRAHLESPREMIVVYDDIDLPVGKLRLREEGSPGTHNGMKSICDALETTKFPRLRFGIRSEEYAVAGDLSDFVLSDFTPAEEAIVEESIGRAVDALLLFARDDLRRAMTEFNRDRDQATEDAESEA